MSAAGTGAAPLAGVRVVELGQLIAGPFCGQILADFGADVIKVEEPKAGDPMRRWGQMMDKGSSLWWPIIARNKKSVTIDLRSTPGQAAARELIKTADILIENFRPGTMEAWGLGYDELAADNPGLIMIRVSGFGQDGPYAGRAGFGAIAEAMGGVRYVSGNPDSPPSRIGISLGDELAGMLAAMGGLMALRSRDRDGIGQVVDCAIYEAVLSFMESVIPEYTIAGHIRERSGSILPNVAPSNVYETNDGESVLIAGNADAVFRRLATAMNQPELATDERYATHLARGRHQAELDDRINDWTKQLPCDDLLRLLTEHGVPAGQIYRVPDMLDDPQYQARQSILPVDDPTRGPIMMQNVFPKLSRTPGGIRWTGAELGAHNSEILQGELGLSAEQAAEAQGLTGRP